MVAAASARSFVPREVHVENFPEIETLYNELLDRPIASAADLEKWLLDFSELFCVVDEYGARRYIENSCHTDDAEIEKRYLHFVENIEPKIKPLYFRLQKRFIESPFRGGLDPKRYFVLNRAWQADVELFRQENVPLETQVTAQVIEYDKTCGAMMVNFRGNEYTLQQLSRFIEEPDRQTRQDAWEATANRRLRDGDKMEDIFEKLLALRHQIAVNSGMDNYRSWMWKSLKRFDYTPDDCLRFADAVAETVVPLVDELDRQRAADLGLPRLRPWDKDVDPKGLPPLRPFAQDDIPAFIQKTRAIFERISPALAAQFDELSAHNNLDLQSRKGKQPGGYQSSLEESRQPFIFMNAAGVHRDVDILLHEGGHAFHMQAQQDEPLVFYRHPPEEFSEVASMSMELLGAEHYDVFYDPAGAARAKRMMFEGIIRLLPWIVTIDSFQHWLYSHPGHTRVERERHWLALLDRFASKLDWSGHEAARARMWHRQGHLFSVPFYYIEYGIAQLGALQLWMKAKEDPRSALANYRHGLKLGGARPLPELFAATGLQFDFSEKTLRPLMRAVGEELKSAS